MKYFIIYVYKDYFIFLFIFNFLNINIKLKKLVENIL